MSIEIVNHTATPVRIENFGRDRYLSLDVMAREWEAVWQRNWLLAGLESDVAASGDFFVFELGREQVLVTRDRDGRVQGFFNVCQHRGNRLVSAQRGRAASFRCAYHAWTYGLDGALSRVPHEEGFAAGVPCAERSLKPVHTELWNGFVFVHLGDDPPPLLEFLGPVAEHLAPYRFGAMTLVQDQTVHLPCNWKAVVDNFSELYHVDFLHPQHQRMVDCCNDTVHLFGNGHTGLAVPGATVNPRFSVPEEPTDIQSAQLTSLGLDPADFRGRVLEVRRAVQLRKREIGLERGFDYAAFSDDQLSDVWQYNLFPNTILSFTPEHLWILRPRPHATDPTRCEFDKLSLILEPDPALTSNPQALPGLAEVRTRRGERPPSDGRRPERDVFEHHAILSGAKSMTDTIDQDIELLGSVQAGMASRGFGSVWLSDDEMRIQHFHNALDAQLAGP
ncbi:MAG: aromatic ring-hydroxylating dioxygenase subunit alpha [Pseudomonadales bacterium]